MLKPESSDTKANLFVYKASAGSGKTHRLTGEYLHLLFAHPYAYRNILAVTFTNKATDEMKMRIVEELFNLASGKSSGYLKELMKAKSHDEEKIRETARKTLINILHDYSAFSVSTIDRFFQQTMRAFTREIGLGGGYNIELDSNKVLREAVDALLYDLERSENKQLLEWLLRFSEEKIENGETWNIRNDIQSLSNEIFKESYKAFSDDIQKDIENKELLDDYKQTLVSVIQNFQKQSQLLGEKGLNIIERFGLTPEDFKNGSRSPFTTFRVWAKGEIKTPSNTFINLGGDIENWYTSKTTTQIRSKIEDAFNGGLNECVCDAIDHYNNTVIYQTAYEINRYFFTLGILGDVGRKIREYSAENNIMLISDTTELLHKIIDGTDSPFIYEKTGAYINHYMIDEFQDTSVMQWANFKPLLKDSLAAGNRNLIVGDVKQSIYRWRNSDWKILSDQLNKDFRHEGINHQSLDTNWRSSYNIIEFNNSIFKNAASILQYEFNESLSGISDELSSNLSVKIEQAYNEIKQHISPDKKEESGHVKIEFIDTKKETDWSVLSLNKIPLEIEILQDKGYSLKDIAILVRTKKEGTDVANTLLEYKKQHPESDYKYDIISDEALFIQNSKSVKLIVSLLKYLQNPMDRGLQSFAIHEYFKFKEQLSTEEALQKHFSKFKEFPDEVKNELNKIYNLPLYEMVEALLNLFHDAIDDSENIYIQSFLDISLDYTVGQSSDLDSFLNWWDETGSNKAIFTPDGQDAIRIMTIHKSKGLGFEAVLIPFCNWEIDHKHTNILWCQPKIQPFNQLQLVPIKYSQKLQNTIFANEYLNEKLHANVDNLNIMYVAFTRAKKELIVFSPKPVKEKVTNISSLLWSSIKPLEDFDEEKNCYEIGEDFRSPIKQQTDNNNEIKINSLLSIPYDQRLRLRLNNKYYFSDNGQREYGTLMHEIISKITTTDNINNVLEDYFLAGDITQEEKTDIKDKIEGFIFRPNVSEWYSGKYRILNEVEILQTKESFIRPDRVMVSDNNVIVIDYKFGEKEDRKYVKQVKYYATQIRKMGYENVKGYICYVNLGKIVEVD